MYQKQIHCAPRYLKQKQWCDVGYPEGTTRVRWIPKPLSSVKAWDQQFRASGLGTEQDMP